MYGTGSDAGEYPDRKVEGFCWSNICDRSLPKENVHSGDVGDSQQNLCLVIFVSMWSSLKDE